MRRKTHSKIDGDKWTQLNTCSVHTSSILASVQLEKSGNLLRQSGKLRAWKGRWCVLGDDRFTFFKDQKAEDAGNVPLGVIEFDVNVSVRITAEDDLRFTIMTSQVRWGMGRCSTDLCCMLIHIHSVRLI